MPIHWIDKNKYITKSEILQFFHLDVKGRYCILTFSLTLPDKTEVIHIAHNPPVKIRCTKQPRYLAKRWLIF